MSTSTPPYEGIQIPERFRNVVYNQLPPAIKAKVDAQSESQN